MFQGQHQASHKTTSVDNSARVVDSTYKSLASKNGSNSCKECCPRNTYFKANDQNSIAPITPSTFSLKNCAEGSILRSRLQVDQTCTGFAVVPVTKKESTTEDPAPKNQIMENAVASDGRTDGSVQKFEKETSVSNTPRSVILQKSVQGSTLNSNMGNLVLVKANSDNHEREDKDVKTKVSRVVYESVRCFFL